MNRSKIALLIILFALLSFALFIGGTVLYFLLYLFILTFLIPLIHSLITLRGLEGSINLPNESLYTGESVDIEYSVKNNSILPIRYMEIHSDISRELTGITPDQIILVLEKKECFTHVENVVLNRRGYYEIGSINIRIRDVFGFYSFSKKITSDASLLVYPEIINISTFKVPSIHESGELLVENSTFQDMSRVSLLREYREGDSIKNIHWKLSAKQGLPIVKEYEKRGDTYVSVFIDNYMHLFKDDVDRRLEDKTVDTALSIINYCLAQDIEVNLTTQNHSNYIEINGQHRSELKLFLGALARFKGNGSLQFKDLLIPKMERFKRASTIIIISPNLDKTIGTYGINLKMKNLNPLFIIITDLENNLGFIDRKIQRNLKEEGILVYIIDYRTNIKERLEAYYGDNA